APYLWGAPHKSGDFPIFWKLPHPELWRALALLRVARRLRWAQPEAVRHGGGLAAGAHGELGEDGGDVMVHGLFRDEQPARDVGVAAAFGQQRQHLQLAVGEALRV